MIYRSLQDLPERYRKSIVEAVDIINSYSVPLLKEVRLFGSVARLDIHVGSDIDLVVVTDEKLADRYIVGNIKNDLEDLSTKIPCDAVFITMNQYKDSDERLMLHIRQESILLYNEEEGFTDDYKQLLLYCKQ